MEEEKDIPKSKRKGYSAEMSRRYYKTHREKVLENHRRWWRKMHPDPKPRGNPGRRTTLPVPDNYEELSAEERRKVLARLYYYKNRERLLERQRAFRAKKKREALEGIKPSGLPQAAVKRSMDLEKVKSLFKDPNAAGHLQWLIEHRTIGN